MEIRLTPSGELRLEPPEGPAATTLPQVLEKTFREDWREGLFSLAANKISTEGTLSLRWWQEFSDRYLSALCTMPEESEFFNIPAPDTEERQTLAASAPPMRGGEYLTADRLKNLWDALDQWVHEAAAQFEKLADFIAARAPRWHQVGRVCFHLAENKADTLRPFAFMATFTMGFGASGQLKHLPLVKAMEHYAGVKNRPALIKLLSPVQRAVEAVPWVKEMVESGAVYQPMAWSADRAYQFLKSASALEESGLSVRLPNWWKKRSKPVVSVTIGNQKSAIGIDAMLDFNVRVALGDETLSPEDLVLLMQGSQGLVLVKGQWVEVDGEQLKAALTHWRSIQKSAKNGEISFIKGMRLLSGASRDLKQEDQLEKHRSWVHVNAGESMRRLLEQLRDPARLSILETGGGLNATLRGYQREGLSWLHLLSTLGLGACLADDMGLGKTVQVLALLLYDHQQYKTANRNPSLLVAPASLLANWRNEARRFTPTLKLLFLHPSETGRQILAKILEDPSGEFKGSDLVFTTYAMAARQEWLAGVRWR